MKKMDPVVHFEMPAQDRVRMADFYTRTFGWEAKLLGEDMGNYVTVTTSPADDKGRPVMPGSINGGFFPVNNDSPALYPSIVIAVENIRESIKKVEKSGGKILGELMDIPGVGQYISFLDTEGNRVGLLQPKM